MPTTHFCCPLEEICYDILEFICLNVSAIMRFCTLSKESCVINIDKEAINGMDMYWKISVKFGMSFNGTIRRLWVWNLHWCGFDIERNIFWTSWFHKYMDLCVIVYISGYSGKAVEECNVLGKNSDALYDSNYLYLTVRLNYVSNFQKRYQLLKNIVLL